jgi:hypothetical protein
MVFIGALVHGAFEFVLARGRGGCHVESVTWTASIPPVFRWTVQHILPYRYQFQVPCLHFHIIISVGVVVQKSFQDSPES